ncbi:MAG: uroporphyrinogen-III synthase [Oceanospirillales bacterium]|nr:MAG: uroporphyrinogen-III synthase [Oceanospirillales bacterium]
MNGDDITQSPPLKNQRILVTRPASQNQTCCDLVNSLGGEAISFPLIEIAPVTETDALFDALKSCILDLDLYQKVIFVSPNAARIGFDWIDTFWPQLPIGVEWIGIGQQTVEQLESLGFQAWCCPDGYDSEALLAHPSMQSVANQRILIIRGNGGRDLMRDTFVARGAKVDYCTVYYRRLPSYSEESIQLKLLDTIPSALLITSGEGLTNLQTLISAVSAHRFQPLYNTLLVVPSERIAKLARELGFQRVTVATGPDDKSMVRAILPEKNWNSWHEKQIG